MTGALAARYPGVDVADVAEIGRSASTNLHLRLRLGFVARAGAPDSLFAKLPPQDPSHRQAIGAAAMGAREANFYAHVAPLLSMRVPDAYFTATEPDGAFLLLLEDLATDGFRISDGSWAVPGELAARALEELAELHVAFEDPAVQQARAPWAAAARLSDRGPMLELLRKVITEHADELSPEYVAVGHLYIDNHAQLEQVWNQGPQTLTHGDPHIGNLFLDGERVGFLDWGMTTIGSPLRDVSYFLTMGVEPEDRRRMQQDLLRHYLDVRRVLGGSAISFDDAWAAHRAIAGYNVVASFLGLTPPYNAPARRLFSGNFRQRAMLALEDLETVAALEAILA
jgi:aminoglycoside/choline kinase family phosphotransferase